MAIEIAKAYEPQEIERHWAQVWFEKQLYRPPDDAQGKVFSIVLPPPNVTGSIHIGHMLEHTQIDIIVRWRRMQGFKTLWLPGIDHAGIATQVVVERQLAAEGLKREQLGREEFERRVWQWKAESGGKIKDQMIRLGVSCDWTRARFTLDPPLYRAVMEAFLRLYSEGLIYRGRYMVNWCPRCQTAISDLETVHESRDGKLWFIRYPVKGSDEFIIVATTRPETMLGDTAVAVHPDDERYKKFVGKTLILPLVNREIPVIADEFVDREFGTGAVKVTPAHDPNDFAMGQRHKLAEIDVMTPDAHISATGGPYAGLERFAAREKIVQDLKAQGLLEKTTNHPLSIAICDRCKTIVEPRLSVQWFCKMKPLAAPAIEAVEKSVLSIVPDNQRKIFLDWLANIRDWCISRQLWWGHRIPIWHCGKCGAMTPAADSKVEVVNGHAQIASAPQACGKCGGKELTQDPDVLDTWFSSGLWPFSTLGWPDDTEDLRTFYPTSLLISGYDILFFWDARMAMLGLHLTRGDSLEERIPFHQLYLHAIVRDPHGIKMSKTRGNVVDPLEIIEKHGTDALRFALAVMAAPGTDIALSEERIMGYRAFANKIWNAARFLFTNLYKFRDIGADTSVMLSPSWGSGFSPRTYDSQQATIADRWIFSRLFRVTQLVNDALENFRFHEAAHEIYHFFWGDFCDWYLEWMKPSLTNINEPKQGDLESWKNTVQIFAACLRLLHPFMPFLTEELWQRMNDMSGRCFRSLSLESFAVVSGQVRDDAVETDFQHIQEVINAARNIRAELKVAPKELLRGEYAAQNPERRALIESHHDAIERLAGLSELKILSRRLSSSGTAIRSGAEWDLHLIANAAIDTEREIQKLKKEIAQMEVAIESSRTLLDNAEFKNKAPAHVFENTQVKMVERQLEHKKLVARLAELKKSSEAST